MTVETKTRPGWDAFFDDSCRLLAHCGVMPQCAHSGEGGCSSTAYTEEPIILFPGVPVKDALLIIDFRQKKSTDPGHLD